MPGKKSSASNEIDPCDYLKIEFTQRSLRNSRYSLRAFARDIGLGPSTLTGVLKGYHGLSRSLALKVGTRINLDGPVCEDFADLFEAKFSSNSKKKLSAQLRIKQRQSFLAKKTSLDTFSFISDWHYMAILELLSLTTPEFFKNKTEKDIVRRLSKSLGLSEIIISESLERLIRLNLIQVTAENQYVATDDYTTIGGQIPSSAIRKFHQQILEKAARVLELQAINRREFSSTVFSIDKNQFAEAQAELRKFRLDFATKYTSTPNRNGVYCLSFQLFDLMEVDL